jgi:hypothetical protein
MAVACKQQRPHVEPVSSQQEPRPVTERDRIVSDRSVIKKEFGALYTDVSALLFKTDPIGINFKNNTDEYEPEVDTILPRLSSCANAADVEKVVHEEFVRWFDRDMAGPQARYRVVAKQIWERYKGTR